MGGGPGTKSCEGHFVNARPSRTPRVFGQCHIVLSAMLLSVDTAYLLVTQGRLQVR